MHLQGETWENSIYPRALGPVGHFARQWLPRDSVTAAASVWLRFGRSILKTKYFRAVDQAASVVLPDQSANSMDLDHLRFIIRFYLEMADMIESSREVTKRRLLPTVTRRLCGLESALEAGRGILMPTIQTSVPLRMIFAEFPKGGRYNLLLHRQYAGIVQLLDKADSSWRFIFLEDSPARRAVEALKRGEVVICNIDHAYPDTEVTLAPVLGRPAIVPSGLFRAAHRLNCLVVPLAFTEEGEDFVITADMVAEWNSDEDFPVSRMLNKIHPELDRAVLSGPEKWFGWGNLMNRWNVWKEYAPH